jgi:chromosome segregation ATPase
MPTIETDLAKILERIEAKIDGVAKNVADIKIDLATTKTELKGEINTVKVELTSTKTELKGEINTLRTELKGEIKTLDEKVTGLSKRVDSVDFINRGVFVALIIAILGGFAKIFGFIGNNP